MTGKQFPNSRIFCAENPGSKSAQPAVFHQPIALFERARIGVENPLALLVSVKI